MDRGGFFRRSQLARERLRLLDVGKYPTAAVTSMTFRLTTLERAFDLARSGQCADVADIVRRLSDEGFGTQQVTGPTLLRQLRDICARSVTSANAPE